MTNAIDNVRARLRAHVMAVAALAIAGARIGEKSNQGRWVLDDLEYVCGVDDLRDAGVPEVMAGHVGHIRQHWDDTLGAPSREQWSPAFRRRGRRMARLARQQLDRVLPGMFDGNTTIRSAIEHVDGLSHMELLEAWWRLTG